MSRDKDYIALINCARWLHLRRDKLTEQPLCERCQSLGLVTAATEVHHIRPVETGLTYDDKRRLMYDPLNLMALCHSCHKQMHRELRSSSPKVRMERQEARTREAIRRLFGEDNS